LPIEEVFVVPAWFSDQRAWIEDPAGSNSVVYNLPMILELEGDLNEELLGCALQKLQARHQVLRSLFRFLDGELVQIVLSEAAIDMPVSVLREIDDTTKSREFQGICRREVGTPFDLSQEPALRACLVQFGDDRHALLLTTHHLVCDDWSTGLLLRELFLIYQALSDPGSTALASRDAFQYADFIRWHEDQLRGDRVASRLSFWTRELKGRGDFHHLQSDCPRPARRTYSGASVIEVLPESLENSLRELSQREKVSLFMTLLAGFLCTAHRWSGDEDIAVGSCAANRALTEMESVAGRFANDLILRVNLSGGPTFRQTLGRIRTRALTAYSYQDLPFGKLVEVIQPEGAPGRNRLFQTMFIFQDAPKEKLQCRGLNISRMPFHSETAKYDLTVYWQANENQLEILAEYNTDLFHEATIRRLLHDYRKTLEEMIQNPDAQIAVHHMPEARPISHPAPSPPAVQPGMFQDLVELRLAKLWQECFRKEEIGAEDDFFELGGDSLKAAQLFAKIEQSFAVRIPIVALIESPTISRLARHIRESSSSERTGSLVEIQLGSLRPPLFCVHGQSGNLLFYRSLAEHLGPDQPVYGLQPQGMDGKLPPLTRVEDMAALYIDEIRRVQKRGPYSLAGYCMGGLIVLEMAQQLKRLGQGLGLVALLDTYNVHNMQQTRFSHLQFSVQRVWFGLCHFLRTDSHNKRRFLQRRLEEFSVPGTVISETNERAAFAYVPKKYSGPLLHVAPERQYARYLSPGLSWDSLVAGGVESFVLPIYPGQLFEEPCVRILAAKLRACIDDSYGQRAA
jgi:thioesterase domain-containing protein/acyl carrier protein